jgi:hypothetical protein
MICYISVHGLDCYSDPLQIRIRALGAEGAKPNTSTLQSRRSGGVEGAVVHFRGTAKPELHGISRRIEELAEQLTSEQVLSLSISAL